MSSTNNTNFDPGEARAAEVALHALGLSGATISTPNGNSITQLQLDETLITDDITKIEAATLVLLQAKDAQVIAHANAQNAATTLSQDQAAADLLEKTTIPTDNQNIDTLKAGLLHLNYTLQEAKANLLTYIDKAQTSKANIEAAQAQLDAENKTLVTLIVEADEANKAFEEAVQTISKAQEELSFTQKQLDADHAQKAQDLVSGTDTPTPAGIMLDQAAALIMQSAIVYAGQIMGVVFANPVMTLNANDGNIYVYDPVATDDLAIARDTQALDEEQAAFEKANADYTEAKKGRDDANEKVKAQEDIVTQAQTKFWEAQETSLADQALVNQSTSDIQATIATICRKQTELANVNTKLAIDEQTLSSLQTKIEGADAEAVRITTNALNDANTALASAQKSFDELNATLIADQQWQAEDTLPAPIVENVVTEDNTPPAIVVISEDDRSDIIASADDSLIEITGADTAYV